MPATIDVAEIAHERTRLRELTAIVAYCTRHGVAHLIAPRITTLLGLPPVDECSYHQLVVVRALMPVLTLY